MRGGAKVVVEAMLMTDSSRSNPRLCAFGLAKDNMLRTSSVSSSESLSYTSSNSEMSLALILFNKETPPPAVAPKLLRSYPFSLSNMASVACEKKRFREISLRIRVLKASRRKVGSKLGSLSGFFLGFLLRRLFLGVPSGPSATPASLSASSLSPSETSGRLALLLSAWLVWLLLLFGVSSASNSSLLPQSPALDMEDLDALVCVDWRLNNDAFFCISNLELEVRRNCDFFLKTLGTGAGAGAFFSSVLKISGT
mmetsp:Transcript_42143/g.101677  ORF Transcript_42143/g.101677 Transcript_42143/m.101677 type:complete len:254 (-) Transcript_42143:167-928(-)